MKFIDKILNKTPDGFVKENVTIARIGAMEYLGSELKGVGVDGLVDSEKYQVHVDADELFKPETIASIEGVDVTFIHPDALEITLKDWRGLTCGHVQNIYQEGDFLKGTIFIKDQKIIDEVEKNGIKEVSLGYDSVIVEKDGKLVKTNIRANHVAIVPEGRCGSACKVGDSKKVVKTMKQRKKVTIADKALIKLSKTTRAKVLARKFGDARKSLDGAKVRLGDSVRKKLADIEEVIQNPEATEEDKQAALESITTISEEIAAAVEILDGANDSVDEAESAVEEIPVADAEGDQSEAETIAVLQQENDELKAQLQERDDRIAELEAEVEALNAEIERLKGDGESAAVVADAKARFPKAKFGDAKTGRQAKEAVLVSKRMYDADGVKKLTDCAIDSEYSKLIAKSTATSFGKKLIGDAVAKPKLARALGGGK